VPISDVRVGDRLLVLPGERIPCDGIVLDHPALVDEQILTGESTPRWKEAGAAVHSGTLNTETSLHLEVLAPAAEGTLSRFVALMRQALQAKSPYQRLADHASAIFLPVVIFLAIAAGAWHGFHAGMDQGLLTGLAVLLIACPCALGIATPLATWIAIGEAARARVVIRGGEALERLAGVKAVRFDKTGTLTTGTPTVLLSAVADGEDRCKVLTAAAGLARASNHAYSVAIRKAVSVQPEHWTNVTANVRTLTGLGLTAPGADGEVLALGSPRLMNDLGLTWPAELSGHVETAQANAMAIVCIGWGGKVRGCFSLQEELRPRAAETLEKLGALKLDLAVLTGDHNGRAAALQKLLGVPVLGELLPEDKVKAIAETQRRVGWTAMVGDGLNDSPALAQSDVGIALACGADITRDAASICLLGDELDRLPWLFELARRTVRTIRLNLFWAFAYNVVGVGLACLGLLNPILAALAMVLSSGFVITNSLRLRQLQQPEAAA
jgi:heavy metal translocating P-type ATPase